MWDCKEQCVDRISALSPGEAGSSWSGGGTTSTAEVTATAKSVEAWPPGIADGAKTGSVFVESPDAPGSSWSRAGGTEGSRVGVFGDGTEGSPAVATSVGEAQPPGGADPLVLRAVERILDMEHEPTLRCLESLRMRTEQVGWKSFLNESFEAEKCQCGHFFLASLS